MTWQSFCILDSTCFMEDLARCMLWCDLSNRFSIWQWQIIMIMIFRIPDVPTASLYPSFHNCKLDAWHFRILKYQLYVAAARKGISQQMRHINATAPPILRQEVGNFSLDCIKFGPSFHMFIGSRCGQRAHDGNEVGTLLKQSESLFNPKVFRSILAALHERQQTLHWFLKLLGQRHGTLKVDLLFAHIHNCIPRAPWILESTNIQTHHILLHPVTYSSVVSCTVLVGVCYFDLIVNSCQWGFWTYKRLNGR